MKKGKPFEVKDKNIRIYFKDTECYKEKTGTCPITNNIETTLPDLYEKLYRNDELYCPSLLYEIKRNGFFPKKYLDEIIIEYNSQTDTYVVNEGRHRVCIASKSDISITAIITKQL